MNSCGYCHKNFSSKSSLDTHIKSAKYCIKLRQENKLNLANKLNAANKFICQYCNVNYSSKQNLATHLVSCKSKDIVQKYEAIIKQNEEKIIALENSVTEWESYANDIEKELKIEKAKNVKLTKEINISKGAIGVYKKQKPRTNTDNSTNNTDNSTNNTIIVNILPKKVKMVKKDNIDVIEKRVLQLIDTYTYDLFLDGPNGFLTFLVNCATLEIENVTERNLVSTDKTRDNFYMLVEKEDVKVWVPDNTKEAINKVIDLIKDKLFKYYDILKSNFVKPPPKLSKIELQDIRRQYEKEKEKERLEKENCEIRGIKYKPKKIVNIEKEYEKKCHEANEQNILNWGGRNEEEAYENYAKKLDSCRILVNGARSNYVRGNSRYKFIEDIAKDIRKEVGV